MLISNNKYELFKDYPETVTVKEMRKMLGGITKYAALKLIYDEKIYCKKIARVYRIPKSSVIDYIVEQMKAICPEIPQAFYSYFK